MATFVGDLSSERYTSTAMSKSSSSSSATAVTSLADSQLKALDGIEIHPFTGIANMRKIIEFQSDRLQAWESDQQYLVFNRVTEPILAKIDYERENGHIAKHTRMTHYTDTDLLIIKLMPLVAHEKLHGKLFTELLFQAARMGIQSHEIDTVGAGRYRGNSSSKEGDSALKPCASRPDDTDWPTIVFEAGLSESLNQLRIDAAWWLTNSNSDVNIVIIISLQKAQSRIQIEKWELALPDPARPCTRSTSSNQQTPTKVHEITIDPNNNVAGAPLVLEFQKIFLRPAIHPGKTDFTFTAQELSRWAANIWAGI
jgi:hypothetical protein